MGVDRERAAALVARSFELDRQIRDAVRMDFGPAVDRLFSCPDPYVWDPRTPWPPVQLMEFHTSEQCDPACHEEPTCREAGARQDPMWDTRTVRDERWSTTAGQTFTAYATNILPSQVKAHLLGLSSYDPASYMFEPEWDGAGRESIVGDEADRTTEVT